MATTINGSNLKPALLAKTGARKMTLKTAAELGGIAAKAAQNDLLPHLVVEQRPTASLVAAGKRVRKPKPGLVKTRAAGIAANGAIKPTWQAGQGAGSGSAMPRKSLALPPSPFRRFNSSRVR